MAQFCDYIIYNTFVNNWDWSSKNWYAASRRNPADVGGPPPGKWTFYTWDAETSMDSYTNSQGFPFSGYTAGPPCVMFNALFNNPDFRRLLGDRIHKHLFNNGALTETRNVDRFEARARQIEYAIIAESARWGDFLQDNLGEHPVYTPAYWHNERDRMINPAYPGGGYFANRTRWLLNNTYTYWGFYPRLAAPQFTPLGGVVSVGDLLTITHVNRSGQVYYTLDGTDPALPGVPAQPVADTILVPEHTSKYVLIPSADVNEAWKGDPSFDHAAWIFCTGSPGGAGYERSSGYEPFISLDVEDQMVGRSPGCYVRIPFVLDDEAEAFTTMTLRVRYDDGFIAYLNGGEIEHVLAPLAPHWDSVASGIHEADGLESFDVSDQTGLLQSGRNILALHGLNASLNSSDFIISGTLSAGRSQTETGISDTAIAYTGPITLTQTTQVKARVFSNGNWSTLNEALFVME